MVTLRRRPSARQDTAQKWLRFGIAGVVLIWCVRQGMLAVSATVSVNLNDGLLLLDEAEGDPLTPAADCDTSKDNNLPQREMTAVRLADPPADVENSATSSCTDFRAYPVPEHQSGLPYLADVFATRDRQELFFIGLNRGICSEEFLKQDGWMKGEYRFMCVFPGNTMVISEYVAPTGDIYQNNYMFKCAIPKEFQHMIVPGQANTNLHVDLHALHNPEGKKKGMKKVPWFPSQKVTDTPRINQIPVCHAGYADLNKQYELVAYTRVQSTYTTQRDKQGKTFQRSTVHRIEEWLDYHMDQGFDHFIIYDNDPAPHGPIEKLTKPFVESGLVTYRWFPLKDCEVLAGKFQGRIKRFGQAAGGLSSMHRLGPSGARYFAHMDVDEFFVVYKDGVTVLDYVKENLTPESKLDVLLWMPTVLEHCDGTVVESESASPMETKQCWTQSHASDVKLIMRVETMLHFQVHFPLTTRKWMKPKVKKVPFYPDKGDGFLAHYRGEITAGPKISTKRSRVTYFDKFIAQRRQKKGLPPLKIATPGRTNAGNEEAEVEEETEEAVDEREEEETEDAGEEGEADADGDAEEDGEEEAEGEAEEEEEEDNGDQEDEGEAEGDEEEAAER